MKKIILFPFLCLTIVAHSQNVNIPDANFKAALVANTSINTNADGEIQVSEAVSYTGAINVASKNISDLTGIQAFTALTGLDCSYNQLTSLNVSQNTSLGVLYCNNNQLSALNVSSNTGLTSLDCSVNQLTALNVSSNISLSVLGCNNNQITSLNISANTSLTGLICGFNQLSALNTTANTALTSLTCGNNNITSLNLSSNTALVTLSCYNNQLTQLSLLTNNALKYLNCQQNQIAALNVSGNTSLKEIRCYNNQLTSLDVKNGNNINFTAFYAYNNPNLSCIQVDNAAYMNTNWASGKDPGAVYSQNCFAGITEIQNSRELITVHPNPSSGTFLVNFFKPQTETKIIVRDELGKCVFKQNYRGEASREINLSHQPRGIYFLEIFADNERAFRKIVLQ